MSRQSTDDQSQARHDDVEMLRMNNDDEAVERGMTGTAAAAASLGVLTGVT